MSCVWLVSEEDEETCWRTLCPELGVTKESWRSFPEHLHSNRNCDVQLTPYLHATMCNYYNVFGTFTFKWLRNWYKTFDLHRKGDTSLPSNWTTKTGVEFDITVSSMISPKERSRATSSVGWESSSPALLLCKHHGRWTNKQGWHGMAWDGMAARKGMPSNYLQAQPQQPLLRDVTMLR